MASRPRRDRKSFSQPLGGTLGSLLKTTMAQAGVVRDVLERGAAEGKARLDSVRRDRQRTDLLASIGEAVIDLIQKGELPELEDHPRIRRKLAALDRLDGVGGRGHSDEDGFDEADADDAAQDRDGADEPARGWGGVARAVAANLRTPIASGLTGGRRERAVDDEREAPRPVARGSREPTERSLGDTLAPPFGTPARPSDFPGARFAERPSAPAARPSRGASDTFAPQPRGDSDGTVASSSWRPPRPVAAPAIPAPAANVSAIWQPTAKPVAGAAAVDPADEDLADYMSPHDVMPPPDDDKK